MGRITGLSTFLYYRLAESISFSYGKDFWFVSLTGKVLLATHSTEEVHIADLT